MIEIGRFTLDGDALSGPADYFADRGGVGAAVAKALDSAVFNYGAAGGSPTPRHALLVALQTDYAGWHGARSLERALEGGR